MTPSHFVHGRVTSSMYGRWRSASSARPISDAALMQRWSPHLAHTQNGRGVPQYREREIAQSTLFSSQSPMRPVFTCAGTQLVAALLAMSSALRSVVRVYLEASAYE